MPNPFSGTIDLDVRNSKPDWGAFLDKKAPANAPNVLVILYDDTGCAAWSPYGGRINSEGVIFAQGSRFGGHSMFVKDGKLSYVYNFLGIPPEQRVTCPAPTSGRHIVGVEFKKQAMGPHHEAQGQMQLYVDEKVADRGAFRTQTGHYALCGEGLCIGYDGGDTVSHEYDTRFSFSGGEVIKVVFDVADDGYVDRERKLAAVMARD